MQGAGRVKAIMSGTLATISIRLPLMCFISLALAQRPGPSTSPEDFFRDPPKPASIKGAFTLVGIGDLLYSHPMANSPDLEFQKVVELIQRGDATISNQEGVFFDLKTFKGQGYGNGLLWGEGTLAKDMKAMGVRMVSVANNHSTDWGPEGLIETRRLLDEAGIVHSGGGRTLQEARKAGILVTPKGRIALISVASTFKPNAGANDAVGEVPSRPGISILRTRKVNLVTNDEMAMIRKLSTALASLLHPAPEPDAQEVTFGEQFYRVSDEPGLRYDMDLYDHAALLKAIRDAKQEADLVVFTIHAHESPTGLDDDTPEPPDFLVRLFHNAVDAGADMILGGGPHSLRGVEIYKGRPVFYGMESFSSKGRSRHYKRRYFMRGPTPTAARPRPSLPSALSGQAAIRRVGTTVSWPQPISITPRPKRCGSIRWTWATPTNLPDAVFHIWPTPPMPAESWKPCRRIPSSSAQRS
jgi:poly-gamma-glutamate capsule biosynthesis protein CapA/YwtB (metallophosphatase superfamily)